jgi:hypothetical protein
VRFTFLTDVESRRTGLPKLHEESPFRDERPQRMGNHGSELVLERSLGEVAEKHDAEARAEQPHPETKPSKS